MVSFESLGLYISVTVLGILMNVILLLISEVDISTPVLPSLKLSMTNQKRLSDLPWITTVSGEAESELRFPSLTGRCSFGHPHRSRHGCMLVSCVILCERLCLPRVSIRQSENTGKRSFSLSCNSWTEVSPLQGDLGWIHKL